MSTERSRPGASTRRSMTRSNGRWGIALALALALLSTACASGPTPGEPIAPPRAVLDAAHMDPRPASPADRDALAKGLRWIRVDAPNTDIQPIPSSPREPAPATGEQP